MTRFSHGLYAAMLLSVPVLAIGVASAEDDGFYESLPNVSIGKVFFSPQQRSTLDQRRGSKTRHGGDAASTDKPEQAKDSGDAAGFIISSKGGARVYANGDFVAARGDDDLVFPSAVRIVRNDPKKQAETDDASD